MRKGRSLRLLKLVTLFIFLLFCTTLALVIWLKFDQVHFDQNTIICGVDVSFMKLDEAYNSIMGVIDEESYVFKFADSQYDVTASSKELGMQINKKRLSELMAEQDERFFDQPMTANIRGRVIDEKKISEYVYGLEGLQEENLKHPVNAKCIFENGFYFFKKEETGYFIDIEEAKQLAITTIGDGYTEVNFSDITQTEPEITIDDIGTQEQLDEVNNVIGTSITYQFYDGSQYTIESDEIEKFITLDENDVPSMDFDGCIAMITEKIAAENQVRCQNLAFKITPEEGEEASRVNMKLRKDLRPTIDYKGEEEALLNELQSGENVSREPYYMVKSLYHGLDTYIELDISRQKLWVYENGECIMATTCITGNPSKGNGTPTGIYFLDNKNRDVHLKSTLPNGQVEYDVPVKYWMRFCGGVGFHDASWRSEWEYTPTRYLTHGSHGCVNLREKDAKILFEFINEHVPIVVYESIVD